MLLRLDVGAKLIASALPGGDSDLDDEISADEVFKVCARMIIPGFDDGIGAKTATQMTPIHDHVTRCVFGVLQVVDYAEIFTLDESGAYPDELFGASSGPIAFDSLVRAISTSRG